MGKVLVSASYFNTLCKEAWALLESNGHEVIFDPNRAFPAYSTEELKQILPGVEAALIGLDDYNEEVLANAPDLKVVAKFGVGVDNIDIPAATRYGIKVINAPGMNSNGVAELAVAMMLGLLRKVIPLHNDMCKGGWIRYLGGELQGKTVGLIGFGAIAKSVAKKVKAFDANVIACDLYPNYAAAEELGVKIVSMEEVIEQSDIVSVHIPATKENYHLFNKDTFARMKKGAYFINTARGALVDLDELSEALQSGHLAGAALDAYEVEPLPADSPIIQCENVILAPHNGSETAESYHRVGLSACKDICALLAGGTCDHCFN